MEAKYISYEKLDEGGVVRITLNLAQARNAPVAPLVKHLPRAVEAG